MTPEDIAKIRTDMGWSRERLSKALGVVGSTIYRWEIGYVIPSDLHKATMYRMRQELDVYGKDVSDRWKTALLMGGIMAFLVEVFSKND